MTPTNDSIDNSFTPDPRASVSAHGGEIDAERFAAIIGGRWETRPPDDWRYRGLYYTWGPYRPGQIIIGQGEDFSYGVDLTTVKGGMGQAGWILASNTQSPDAGMPVLRVDSPHEVVRRLAGYLRSGFETPIVAVTGSVGKTSSCYLLYHLLGYEGRVNTNGQDNYTDGIFCEMGNLNISDYLVVEAPLQALGEATAALKPHVAVLTHLSPVHMELQTDLLALAESKARLFSHLAPNGTAIINRDIAYFDRVSAIAKKTAATILTFGEHAEADLRLMDYDPRGQYVRARISGKEVEYELGIPGRHMAVNSLGALAAGLALGVKLTSLLAHCATAQPVAGRGALTRLKIAGKQISIVDDSHNASPASMAAAFTNLAMLTPSGKGRRIAVLADMLELGESSAEYHKQLAEPLLQSAVDKVHLAGELMDCLWARLPTEKRGSRSRETSGLLRPLVSDIKDGDIILLKGSYGTQMHQLAADLRYLTLAPALGLSTFIALRTYGKRIEPYVPKKLTRWITWQIKKGIKRRMQP